MQLKYQIGILAILGIFNVHFLAAQQEENNSIGVEGYKKRVLENTEIDFLSSYYSQDGNNAAVSGGTGTEELTDFTPTIVVSIPLNVDDVLTIDAGVSAYTSASSSNINPFDGAGHLRLIHGTSPEGPSLLWRGRCLRHV